MKYLMIGKIVNTHALKGEVRLLSFFEYKNKIFIPGNKLFIGINKDIEEIESYRTHKNFDMIKFKGIDYINDVLKYKGCNVYIDEDELKLNDDEILVKDYPLYEVYNDENLVGKITEYRNDNGNEMIKINDKFIPYNKDFITKIDKSNKKIYMHDIGVFL